MNDHNVIVDLLNNFSSQHNNVSWKINCVFSDGRNKIMNQIRVYNDINHRTLGTFTYDTTTGITQCFFYKGLRSHKPENIVDVLLDMINHSNE
ncbi:MAG TPA: hypothetical protein ACFCUD_11060 [Cyclobacteriaceae bacterium]